VRIAAIQSRLPFASPGQLSLASGEAGALSVVEDGGLSVVEDDLGAADAQRAARRSRQSE